MKDIIYMTIEHYRQKCVMYYVLSDECQIVWAKPKLPTAKEMMDHRCTHGYTMPSACLSCVNSGMTVAFEEEEDDCDY